MNKMKWVKLVFVVLFIVLAGILYSCRAGNREEVTLITNMEESTAIEGNVESNEDRSSIQANDNVKAPLDSIESIGAIDHKTVADNVGEKDSESENSPNYIYVHICGEVLKPDVYKVQESTRVYEVIAKAGGLTALAADSYINQAAVVSDGQQIFIPSIDEVADMLPAVLSSVSSTKNTDNSKGNDAGIVNINIASAEELMTLSGVGQAKAQAIIDYRMNKGSFKAIDEIKNIDGIKDAVFNKIKDKITVN